jgi:hypothetical protein
VPSMIAFPEGNNLMRVMSEACAIARESGNGWDSHEN